ncbi:UNVERIFIED_CONTAM: hypothetical protein Sangu_0386700 [Sesamum angustifolium]|uniref:DUF4283 domain-containing protein n=1 Tax=Sesamum angustifolium TaxID=2727405 RepID=A0AAW2QS02_9LAMI
MGGMESNLEQLSKAWKLTEDEEIGVTLPSGLWEANTDSLQLCLVGRLLSNRPIRFVALCLSLQSMLLPMQGMEIKQLEDGRFLLHFKHRINRKRALEGWSWNFEKNILILNSIGELENHMQVASEV